MAVKVATPSSDVEANMTEAVPSANHWDNLDTDDQASYNGHIHQNEWKRDLYGLANKPTDIGTVNSVTVYVKITSTSSVPDQFSFKFAIRSNGVVTEFELAELVDSDNGWVTRSKSWATNPDTGSPWTASEIAKLVAGFVAKSSSSSLTRPTRCCYLYVKIDYNPEIAAAAVGGSMASSLVAAGLI